MKRFPKEFSDLLNKKGHRVLERGHANPLASLPKSATPFMLATDLIDESVAKKCQRLLDRKMYEQVRPIRVPVPPETITEMTVNYDEKLPKSMSFKTATFYSKSAKSYRVAEEIGLFEMMESESFFQLAKALTGFDLINDTSAQCILYEEGDYAGPHNDHHPEHENALDGYVDVHLMFANDLVTNQHLIYEKDGGFLNGTADITICGSIAVYKLPFWHYTTPLLGKKRGGTTARRWLLLGSFDIQPKRKRRKRKAK